MKYQLLTGDSRKVLRTLPDQSVHTVVTSPPYFCLRDYGVDGQIGLEETPAQYVAELVTVFRECWRVLRDDGVCWLNLGDSYNSGVFGGLGGSTITGGQHNQANSNRNGRGYVDGLKPKDLIGIPWRVAFALQDDGWYLRSDCIWHKPNPMPESVTDRPTKAHEYVFLLTKSQWYYYDADAVAEESTNRTSWPQMGSSTHDSRRAIISGRPTRPMQAKSTRNRRSVWTIATKPYSGAHFATMPPDLAEICIKAGCPEGGTVLDPFNGSGTTGAVACAHGRDYIGIDLNDDYIALAHDRIREAINASGRAPVATKGRATDTLDLPLFA